MVTQDHSQTSTLGKWTTIAIWAVGITFLLARPWFSTFFGLNTDSFMFSVMGPIWAFILVCLLALLLQLFRKPAEKWRSFWRIVFALVCALVLILPQADLIMVYRESGQFPHYIDPLRYILLWVTPLTFYVVPAGIVVASWLQHNRLVSPIRSLGLALVVIGVVYIPFGLWLTQQAIKYSQP